MDLTPATDVDAAIREAIRISAAQEGIPLDPTGGVAATDWWRAGVLEATQRDVRPLERAPDAPGRPAEGYPAARSPRRTRGATRA